MGTIIEFPAGCGFAASGQAWMPRRAMEWGPILILPVIRIERRRTKPAAVAGRSRAQRRAAVVVAAAIRLLQCRSHPPDPAVVTAVPVLALLSARRSAAAAAAISAAPATTCAATTCIAGSGAEVTGSVGLKRLAIPAHRQRTPASRSRLSPDRAAAVAAGLEERVRRLQAAAVALAAEGRVRPHHVWPHADRRAAPLAFLALCAADRGRAQRHHPLRAVLRLRDPRHRSRQQAQCQPWRASRSCRQARGTMRSRACGRTR